MLVTLTGNIGFPALQGIFEDDEENKTARRKVEELLDEFNKDRPTERRLVLNKFVTSGYRIKSADEPIPPGPGEEEELGESYIERVKQAQTDFADFREFLKGKYFGS